VNPRCRFIYRVLQNILSTHLDGQRSRNLITSIQYPENGAYQFFSLTTFYEIVVLLAALPDLMINPHGPDRYESRSARDREDASTKNDPPHAT
jgi:hypothetical protein